MLFSGQDFVSISIIFEESIHEIASRGQRSGKIMKNLQRLRTRAIKGKGNENKIAHHIIFNIKAV
jgi:hypothetical protein